jgi:hypothetical protein
MMSDRSILADMLKPLVTLIVTVATIAANIAVNAIPLFGRSTEEISDEYSVLVTPAGFAFAIWGLIYLLLVAFALYQFTPRERAGQGGSTLDRIFWPYMVASAANVVWLVLWHGLQIQLTLLAMAALLLSLAVIYVRLDVGRAGRRGGERLMVELPFSVYIGWITVASIVNFSIVLSRWWDGAPLTPQIWASVLCVAAAGLAAVIVARHRDVAYALVIAWALLAIGVGQSGEPPVPATAFAMSAVAAGCAMWGLVATRRTQQAEGALAG